MSDLVSLALRVDPPRLPPGRAAHVHAVIELSCRRSATVVARPPNAVFLLVDTSGSMAGEPLRQAIASVAKVSALLRPVDRLAVIGFASGASTVACAAPLDEPTSAAWPDTRATLLQRATRLVANGGTSYSAAFALVSKLLAQVPFGVRPIVLLLSDGRPNEGVTSTRELADAARAMTGATVCALGYGAAHDEDVLRAIADAGRGTYSFVADPEEAQTELVRALGAQDAVVANDVSLLITPSDDVEIEGFVGPADTRMTARGVRVAMKDLVDERTECVVVRLAVRAPREAQSVDLVDVCARCHPIGTAVAEVARALRAPSTNANVARDDHAATRVLLARAEEVRKCARALADARNFEAAAAAVRAILDEISAQSFFRAGDGSVLALSYEQLVDERVAYEQRPSAEHYAAFRKQSMAVDLQQGDDPLLIGSAHASSSQWLKSDGPATADLVVERGPLAGRSIPLRARDEITFGRVGGNSVVLPHGNISKRHVRIVARDGKHIVVDLKTTNGTYVNGKRVGVPHVLRDDDVIQLGDNTMRYRRVTSPSTSASIPSAAKP